VPRKLSPDQARALADRVSYYRDLGIHDFYRRASSAEDSVELDSGEIVVTEEEILEEVITRAKHATISTPVKMPEADMKDPVAALRVIREDIGDCVRCRLHEQGRKQIVFGVGNPQADLMFVGEGPGADEDEQGEPFVGRAGQLLNKMIEAMGVKREDVYIANVVKCRPPGNRTPERDECETCSPFLYRQIDVVKPKAIVALGAVAAKNLLGINDTMGNMRGRWYDYRGTQLRVTFHPAYLLRDPRQKGEAWKDLQEVMKYLGLEGKKNAGQ
jgi:uracil-DNA glycosylase family 4